MTDFQNAWPTYQALGWSGTIPLPRGEKWPPPAGFTGRAGVDPTPEQCAAWGQSGRYRNTRQTAVRVPVLVKGLDVDGYDGRTGLLTMQEGERRWGALPPGPWSSSREDGSGILWFRVPAPVQLVSEVKFHDLGLGHVEVVQHHHRYGVVWPSIHPKTGAAYTWRDTAGPHVPPAVADLPELPAGWIEGLDPARRRTARPVAAMHSGDHTALIDARVAGILRRVTDAGPGEKNNVLSWGAGRLFQLARDGELDPATAEELLHNAARLIHRSDTEATGTIRSARRWVLGA